MVNDYNRITDNIYTVNDKLKIAISVQLTKENGDKRPFFYHSEYENITNAGRTVSVMRETVPMLIFKYSNAETKQKEDVVFLMHHMPLLQDALNHSKEWFNGSKSIFGNRNGRLFVMKDTKEARPIILSELLGEKTITFEPCIVFDKAENSQPGLRIILNNSAATDIEAAKAFGLFYLMENFNLYMAASLLINYAVSCTPGTNRTSFDNRKSGGFFK